MQTVMRDFFFFFFFFFFGSFSFLRFFRRIFSNFKKISTLSEREREREREIFSTKKEKIFTSLHSPSRALFCDAAQKTRIQKKRTRKRERNANRGHESHAFAVASRVRLYRGVHLFLSPHFFFLNRSPQSFNFLATDPGVPLCARANRNGNTGVSIEGEDLTQTIAFQTPGGPRVPLHSVVVRSSSKLNFFFAFTSDFSNFEPPPPFVNTLVVSIPSFVGVKFQN